jgi:hypothetical protein
MERSGFVSFLLSGLGPRIYENNLLLKSCISAEPSPAIDLRELYPPQTQRLQEALSWNQQDCRLFTMARTNTTTTEKKKDTGKGEIAKPAAPKVASKNGLGNGKSENVDTGSGEKSTVKKGRGRPEKGDTSTNSQKDVTNKRHGGPSKEVSDEDVDDFELEEMPNATPVKTRGKKGKGSDPTGGWVYSAEDSAMENEVTRDGFPWVLTRKLTK